MISIQCITFCYVLDKDKSKDQITQSQLKRTYSDHIPSAPRGVPSHPNLHKRL